MKAAANNHHCPIPGMVLEFNLTDITKQSEFTLRITKHDLVDAVLLEPPLEYIPSTNGQPPFDVIRGSGQDNDGGKLSVSETDSELLVNFGFTPLPARAELSRDPALSYFERFVETMLPLRDHLEGRSAIFQALALITNLQYQYVPTSHHDDITPRLAGARFSFLDGVDVQEPRIIVSETFDRVMQAVTRDQSVRITQGAAEYLRYLDPTRLADKDDAEVLSFVSIPNYRRLFSSGESSVGQRSENLTQEEISDTDTDRDYRLQPGDQYIAAGHNLDTVSNPQLISMIAIGSIHRLMRMGTT